MGGSDDQLPNATARAPRDQLALFRPQVSGASPARLRFSIPLGLHGAGNARRRLLHLIRRCCSSPTTTDHMSAHVPEDNWRSTADLALQDPRRRTSSPAESVSLRLAPTYRPASCVRPPRTNEGSGAGTLITRPRLRLIVATRRSATVANLTWARTTEERIGITAPSRFAPSRPQSPAPSGRDVVWGLQRPSTDSWPLPTTGFHPAAAGRRKGRPKAHPAGTRSALPATRCSRHPRPAVERSRRPQDSSDGRADHAISVRTQSAESAESPQIGQPRPSLASSAQRRTGSSGASFSDHRRQSKAADQFDNYR
jgi:hypothetical protein